MPKYAVRDKFCHPTMTPLNLDISFLPTTLDISGLTYIINYVTADEQKQLLKLIDQQTWALESVESKRRIQQHGYRYDYHNGILVAATYLGPLPAWAANIAKRIYSDRLISKLPDQLTVNEYKPGQGLTSHVDCVTCFGSMIATLSLGSSYVMEFTHIFTGEKRELLLLPGSLLVLKEEARYDWRHSVTPRDKDVYFGQEFVRSRRVAVTFREALFPYK
jgi:alkylated DNA repair dioxygenase AlkB